MLDIFSSFAARMSRLVMMKMNPPTSSTVAIPDSRTMRITIAP